MNFQSGHAGPLPLRATRLEIHNEGITSRKGALAHRIRPVDVWNHLEEALLLLRALPQGLRTPQEWPSITVNGR